ncbi:universal stress protein [Saprospiraceae bacterium]|nr:universal stress protein [Saprospiraceae bacterium]
MKDNILNIKIFGTETSAQNLIIDEMTKQLKLADLSFVIRIESDVTIFLKEGIESVPAIQFDEGPIVPFRSNGHFFKSLRKNITEVLASRKFGSMQSITIPTDFSDNSLNAVYFGHRLASEMGLVTKILHVYHPSSTALQDTVYGQIDFSLIREEHLSKFVDKIDLDWTTDLLSASYLDKEFRTGFPAEQIISSVQESNSSFILMGTTGDSHRIKKWFGSVSTAVMNDAKVPVILIPQEAKYHKVHNILYAYDEYEMDKSCVGQLVDFAKKLDANIHFVHVNEDGKENPGYYLKELIDDQFYSDKVKTEVLNTQTVTDALNDYAITHEIDMLAFGTTQKNLLQKIFNPSVTKRMALQSKLPLLILKK